MIYEYLEFLSVFFVFGSLFFWVSSLSVCVYHFQLSISTPIEKPVSSFSIISHPKHPAYWFWQSKIRMETVKLVQSTDLTHSFEWISFFLWSIVNLLDFLLVQDKWLNDHFYAIDFQNIQKQNSGICIQYFNIFYYQATDGCFNSRMSSSFNKTKMERTKKFCFLSLCLFQFLKWLSEYRNYVII